jgi:hypothetical protein
MKAAREEEKQQLQEANTHTKGTGEGGTADEGGRGVEADPGDIADGSRALRVWMWTDRL